MQKNVELLEPRGDCEQFIIDVDCRRRGLPPCEREWVCQHSCAPETIPDCQDMNCEGTTVVNSACIAAVCDQAARGDFASFDATQVRLRFNVDASVVAELEKAASDADLLPGVEKEGATFVATGSLLAFARYCALRINQDLSESARAVLMETEHILASQFYRAGAALFQQRHVDLRTDRASRGNVILFLGSGVWPVRALVGWEVPERYSRRYPAPANPAPNRGFGLRLEGKAFCLGPIDSGLHEVPGDLYGPQTHLEFRVDQAVADRVIALCNEYATAVPENELADTALGFMRAVVHELGLPIPVMPPAHGDEEGVCVRPAQFIRRLLLAQHLG
ncbi:MAG: hypothetical protein HYS18_02190 [Burkholderiales bacterium]|nr:hypothetical protein [Burkholderiales bacterium]